MAKITRAIRRRPERVSLLGSGMKGLAGFSLAAAGSWIVYSMLVIDHNMVLPDAIPAERVEYNSPRAGKLSFYRNRIGDAQTESSRPLVLIHSINAAASAYEMRPLFMHFRTSRPVYALDLPGFGFSERSRRVYTPALYEAAITDFLAEQVGRPADVVALSLGSEFSARAALAHPELFYSLSMISPSGFSVKPSSRSQAAGRSRSGELLHAMFSFPAWARPFYDLLTTHASIEYFLKQSFIGQVPQELMDYAYMTAHQPGAEYAPLYFISGQLFTANIRHVYEQLQVPTLVLYDRDTYVNFDMLPETLAKSSYWQAVRLVPTLGLPHFERTQDTVEVLEKFWK